MEKKTLGALALAFALFINPYSSRSQEVQNQSRSLENKIDGIENKSETLTSYWIRDKKEINKVAQKLYPYFKENLGSTLTGLHVTERKSDKYQNENLYLLQVRCTPCSRPIPTSLSDEDNNTIYILYTGLQDYSREVSKILQGERGKIKKIIIFL